MLVECFFCSRVALSMRCSLLSSLWGKGLPPDAEPLPRDLCPTQVDAKHRCFLGFLERLNP